MKKLFRDRKTSIDSKSRPVVTAPAPLTAAETPLYARFASAQRSHDNGGPTKPTVSVPRQLTSKPSLTKGSSTTIATAPTVKNNAAERQAKGISRMPSRTAQDPQKHQVLNQMPSRTNHDGVKTQAMDRRSSRIIREEQRPQVFTSSPPRQASRPELTSPVHEDPRTTFPRMQSLEFTGGTPFPQGLVAPRMEWTPTASTSSLTSDSVSYSPPPRQLVVRNFDPDNDSVASSIARPPHVAAHNSPQDVSPPTADSKSHGISSPLSQPTAFYSGVEIPFEKLSASPSSELRHPSPARPALTQAHNLSMPIQGGRIHDSTSPSHSELIQPPAAHPSRPSPTRLQETIRHESEDILPSAPPTRKLSLLSTPSITRKKYSPMAAFGLPVAQVNSTTSPAASTSSVSTQEDKPPEDVGHGNAHLHAPETHEPPSLPPLDVSSSSYEGPLLNIDLSNWRKTASENASKRVSQVGSPSKRISDIPTIPPSPASPPQSQLPDIDEYGLTTERTLDDTTITAARHQSAQTHPSKPLYSGTVPVHSPTEPEPGLLGTSSTFHSALCAHQPRPLPSQPSPNLSHKDMPDVGKTRFHSKTDSLPSVDLKAHAAQVSDRHVKERNAPARTLNIPDEVPRHAPPDQHDGPVQGRPRIFAAMEATEMSDVDNLNVDPRMVGLISGVSVAMKTEEVHEFSPQAAYQTPHATPPPPPAKEEKAQRKKLSKARREHSSRKTDPVVVDTAEKPAPTRHGSSRTVVRNPDDEGARAAHQPSTVSPSPVQVPLTGLSGSPIRTREELERHGSNTEQHSRKSGSSSDNKLHRRSRDGVKTLTDKQMEKLNNRKSYGGGSPSRQPESYASPPKRPTPLDHTSAYPPPPHKLSYRSTAPFIPTQPAEGVSPPTPTKRSHHAGQLSISHGAVSRHASPQLPTPPEEYQPTTSTPQKPRREKKSVSPPLHRHTELPSRSREATPEPRFYPLVVHLAHPVLLEELLSYLTYYEWLMLASVAKDVRRTLYEEGREQVLERYLRTVGYARWAWNTPEPLKLRVEDLCHYMRGVSTPIHQYAATATSYLQSQSSVSPRAMQELTFSCRAFTRVVLRLRVQAEAEAMYSARSNGSPNGMQPRSRTLSNAPHRTPSKWSSQTSFNASRASSRAPSPAPSSRNNGSGATPVPFQSPLFRLRRAPLLQVFVPSPDGDWLSDTSVLECEAELKRAGVLHLMRAGDVVWDVAVGDEANVGRLIWDGNYLIDLDYSYSRVGDAPRYLPALAFPPSYFHRVIRTMGTGNPIVRIDISPWADEIQANLQLIQDRMRTDTPQGGRHMVVRWVHRSSFSVRPPQGSKSIRLPMPSTAGPGPSPTGAWIVDPGWFGTVIVETEGTNEGLADLQARCRGAVPHRGPASPELAQWEERRLVFRILRERSRPGEICIRVVSDKERIIPL